MDHVLCLCYFSIFYYLWFLLHIELNECLGQVLVSLLYTDLDQAYSYRHM